MMAAHRLWQDTLFADRHRILNEHIRWQAARTRFPRHKVVVQGVDHQIVAYR